MPPLQPLTGTSTVLAPTAIALSAIREALDAQAPKNLSGKPQNPVSKLLSDRATHLHRQPRAACRVPASPACSSSPRRCPANSRRSARSTGAVGTGVSTVGNAVGNLIGGSVGSQVQNLAGKAFDEHTDIQGTRDDDVAADHRAELAARAQSRRTGQRRRRRAADRRAQAQRRQRGQAGARRCAARPDGARWKRICATIRSSKTPRAPNGPSCAIRFRSARRGRACRIFGSKCGPFAPSRRSRRSTASAVTLLVGVQAQTRIVPSQTQAELPVPATARSGGGSRTAAA